MTNFPDTLVISNLLVVKLYLKSLFFWGEILQPAMQLVLITGSIIFKLFSFTEGDNNLKSDEVS